MESIIEEEIDAQRGDTLLEMEAMDLDVLNALDSDKELVELVVELKLGTVECDAPSDSSKIEVLTEVDSLSATPKEDVIAIKEEFKPRPLPPPPTVYPRFKVALTPAVSSSEIGEASKKFVTLVTDEVRKECNCEHLEMNPIYVNWERGNPPFVSIQLENYDGPLPDRRSTIRLPSQSFAAEPVVISRKVYIAVGVFFVLFIAVGVTFLYNAYKGRYEKTFQ